MKKTLAAILVAVMLTLALVSCGDGSLDYSKVSLAGEGYVTVEDYKSMGNFLSYFMTEPTDADIRDAIPEHLAHLGVAPVAEAAEMGDIVNINYVGTIDGVAFEGGTADDQFVELGSGAMIDGFEEGIVGMSADETKTIDVTFPEDYHSEELAGKGAQFEITLNGVYDGAILDDAETIAHVKAELTSQGTSSVWSILAGYVKVNKYPEDYVQSVAKNIYKNYEYQYRAMGYMENMDHYGITMESCIEEAKKSIDDELAVYALVQAENITYTKEEYEAKAAEMAPLYGFTNVNEFKAAVSKKAIETELYRDKVIDRVIELNEVPDIDIEDEHDHDHDHEHTEEVTATEAPDATAEVTADVTAEVTEQVTESVEVTE